MQEIWKEVKGYDGIYEVSNLGNVKSVDRIVLNKGKYPFLKNGKIIKKRISTTGYYIITLCKNGVVKTFEVHKLVAMAFLNHKPNGHKLVIDHIDNNPLNNNLTNLQIISNRKNTSKDKTSKYNGVYFRKKTNNTKVKL